MKQKYQTFKKNALKASEFLKALAHAERLLILCQLVEGEKSVSELLEDSPLSQSAFSQHLSVLRRKEMVNTRKESQVVFYSIADQKIAEVLNVLHQQFCTPEKKRKRGDKNGC
ncbi:ArsR/SmtB family transcription factor [Candidatus Riflebacteria bacterium]